MAQRLWASSLASVLRTILGPSRYRQLRLLVDRRLRFDEVIVVWRSIGKAFGTDGVLIDIGGHHGESAELFADLGWEVHCFEPNPSNWASIERRVTSRYSSSRLVKSAVGEVPEAARTFFTSDVSSGISSLHAFHASHRASYSVSVTTMQHYCLANNIRRVDFLKVDTEGFDLFVLKGNDWEMISPRVVICEFEDRKTSTLGYSYHDMAQFLKEKGYRVIVSEWEPIVDYGGQHVWKRYADYPADLLDEASWGNLIAISDQEAEELILEEIRKLWPGELEGPKL